MAEREKKYRWRRTWPDEVDLNGKPFEDYVAQDEDIYAGRIRLEENGPTKGLWQWAGSRPPNYRGKPIVPNAGYCKTAADAAKTVEDYWDAMKRKSSRSL